MYPADNHYLKMKSYLLIALLITSIIPTATGYVDDSYTSSLLHYEGLTGSAIFTDENPLITWQAHGGITINGEMDPVWGNNTVFDGTGTYIDTQEDTGLSFNLGRDNWTWDSRILYTENDVDFSQGLWAMGQYRAGNPSVDLNIHKSSYGNPYLYITFYQGTVTYGQWRYQMPPAEYAEEQWYHIQISRCGNETIVTDGIPAEYVYMALFIDGVEREWLHVASPPGYTRFGNMKNMTLGRNDAAHIPNRYFWGKLDETRFSPGICRNTESFTPPAAPYPSVPPLTAHRPYTGETSIADRNAWVVMAGGIALIGAVLFFSRK